MVLRKGHRVEFADGPIKGCGHATGWAHFLCQQIRAVRTEPLLEARGLPDPWSRHEAIHQRLQTIGTCIKKVGFPFDLLCCTWLRIHAIPWLKVALGPWLPQSGCWHSPGWRWPPPPGPPPPAAAASKNNLSNSSRACQFSSAILRIKHNTHTHTNKHKKKEHKQPKMEDQNT